MRYLDRDKLLAEDIKSLCILAEGVRVIPTKRQLEILEENPELKTLLPQIKHNIAVQKSLSCRKSFP